MFQVAVHFCAHAREVKAWEAVRYLAGSTAARGRGRGFLSFALPLARTVRIGLTQHLCSPAELTPSQPNRPPNPAGPRTHHLAGQYVDQEATCWPVGKETGC